MRSCRDKRFRPRGRWFFCVAVRLMVVSLLSIAVRFLLLSRFFFVLVPRFPTPTNPRISLETPGDETQTHGTTTGLSSPLTCCLPTSSSRIIPTSVSHLSHSSSHASPLGLAANSSRTCLSARTILVSVEGDGVRPRETTRVRSRMRAAVDVRRDDVVGGMARAGSRRRRRAEGVEGPNEGSQMTRSCRSDVEIGSKLGVFGRNIRKSNKCLALGMCSEANSTCHPCTSTALIPFRRTHIQPADSSQSHSDTRKEQCPTHTSPLAVSSSSPNSNAPPQTVASHAGRSSVSSGSTSPARVLFSSLVLTTSNAML